MSIEKMLSAMNIRVIDYTLDRMEEEMVHTAEGWGSGPLILTEVEWENLLKDLRYKVKREVKEGQHGY
jgi:hypothetical protein